jgi:hypothetical protein
MNSVSPETPVFVLHLYASVLLVGCKKCPAFTVCPLKSLIGDYKKEDITQQQAGKENREENKTK